MFTVLMMAVLATYPGPTKQLQLDEGMTMGQALELLGEPDATESTTCGAKTPKPWNCRKWIYTDNQSKRLVVYFGFSKEFWVIDSWDNF